MDAQAPILIVGAGQAGVQIAESLRQEGYQGELLLIGEELHPPYQRPPLSKKWLIEAGAHSALALRGADALARRQDRRCGSDTQRGRRSIGPPATLQLDSGERLAYEPARAGHRLAGRARCRSRARSSRSVL